MIFTCCTAEMKVLARHTQSVQTTENQGGHFPHIKRRCGNAILITPKRQMPCRQPRTDRIGIFRACTMQKHRRFGENNAASGCVHVEQKQVSALKDTGKRGMMILKRHVHYKYNFSSRNLGQPEIRYISSVSILTHVNTHGDRKKRTNQTENGFSKKRESFFTNSKKSYRHNRIKEKPASFRRRSVYCVCGNFPVPRLGATRF